MGTIIDELIVSLSLDPKKFQQGQKEAVASLKKLEEQAAAGGKNIEKSVGGVEESFGLLQKRLIGVAALLFGGLSIDKFIEKMTKLNVATANLSGWTGVSTQNLRTWSQAAERAGTSGDAAAQGFGAITRQRTDWLNNRNQGGLQIFQSGANAAARGGVGTGVSLFGGADNSTLLPDEVVAERLHKWLQSEIKAGRGTTGRAALRDNAGLPEEFVTMLANPNLLRLIEEAKKNSPSDKEVEDYKKLNEAATGAHQSIELLARAMVNASGAVPKLTEFFNFLSKVINYWTGDPETKKQVDADSKDLHEDLQNRFGKTDDSAGKPWWERLNDLIDQKLGVRGPNDHEPLGTGKQLDENTEELRKLNDKLKGGLQNQSFTGGGAGDGGGSLLHNIMYSGGGAAAGGGASGEGGSGGGPRWPGRGMGTGGEGEGVPGGDGAGLVGSEFLKAQRSGIRAEIEKTPGLRDEVAGMLALEGTPTMTMESLANRTVATNEWRKSRGLKPLSVRQMLHSGFYGPINRGQLRGAIAGLQRNPKRMQQMQGAMDAVLDRGSNTVLGATDQGMPSDPNGRHVGSDGFRLHPRGSGNVFNDWGGGGGHTFNERWRRQQQQRVRESAPTGVGDAPLPSPDPRKAQEWTNLLGSTHLAAYSPGGDGGINTSHNMTVGSVHVHTAATDAPGIASAIKPALQRFAGVMSSNNGPT